MESNASNNSTDKTNNDSNNECESRQTSYIKFMSSIPRLCSPTVCGTANYKTPKQRKKRSDSENSLMCSFNWSIEQMALLNPCDFSNTEDFIQFKQIDEQIVSKQLDEENDQFFSQNQIIPSPKTPQKSEKVITEMGEKSIDSKWSPIYRNDKTPEYQSISRDSLVIDSFGTPLNCSKLKQKKKLFRDEHYLLESCSRKDSVIDSQSLFSPIYSPNWRNTSLSHRITFLSPICSKNENDLDNEDSICEASMKTEVASHSNMTYDMVSIESQNDRPKSRSSIYNYLDTDYDNEFDILCNNDNNYYDHCDHRVLKRFLTKTSTPSHL